MMFYILMIQIVIIKSLLITYTKTQITTATETFLLCHSIVTHSTARIMRISKIRNSHFTILKMFFATLNKVLFSTIISLDFNRNIVLSSANENLGIFSKYTFEVFTALCVLCFNTSELQISIVSLKHSIS